MINGPLLELLVQLRKRYTALGEALDLTQQMADALDRDDRISFSLLLSMRQDVVLRLQETDERIQSAADGLAPDMQKKWQALLNGSSPTDDGEQQLAKQMQQNRQLLEHLIPLDQRIQQSLSTR